MLSRMQVFVEIGGIFGRLTVTEKIGYKKMGLKNRLLWKCVCSCGNEIITRDDSLKGGRTNSCGCIKNTSSYTEFKKVVENEGYEIMDKNFIFEKFNALLKIKVKCPVALHPPYYAMWKTWVRGQRCPYCAGQRAYYENCLQTLNPQLAKEWHPTKNKNLTSEDVMLNSHRKVWWICEFEHEWEAPVYSRTHGHGCPYCANNIKHSLKFVKDYIGSYNYKLHSSEYTNVNTHLDIECPNGHHYKSTFTNFRFGGKTRSGCRCPHCWGSTSEEKIKEILSKYNFKYKTEHQIPECKNINPLRFDFKIQTPKLENEFILLEYDGEHHYYDIHYKGQTQEVQKRDKIKDKYCSRNEVRLIRISYKEKENIENILIEVLGVVPQ